MRLCATWHARWPKQSLILCHGTPALQYLQHTPLCPLGSWREWGGGAPLPRGCALTIAPLWLPVLQKMNFVIIFLEWKAFLEIAKNSQKLWIFTWFPRIQESLENAGPASKFWWCQGSLTFEAKKKQRLSSSKLLHVACLKPNWVVECVSFYVSGQ